MLSRSVLLVALASLLACSVVLANDYHDRVISSHADVAHAPVDEAVFVPHSEMQAPGSVVHHEIVQDHQQQQQQQQHPDETHHQMTPERSGDVHLAGVQENPGAPHEQVHEAVQVAKAPEHQPVKLRCAWGRIHVIDTSFGQGQGAYDFSSGIIEKGHCHAAIDVSHFACQGAQSCDILADSGSTLPHGSDPCPGVFKRAVVTFKCNPDVGSIPAEVVPIAKEHSPQVQLHQFLPPPSMHFAAFGQPHPPSMQSFFSHFFHNQIHSTFPFPDGKECEADAHRLCGGLLKECVGAFDCVSQCVTDHAPVLSPGCLAAHPCWLDIENLCSDKAHGSNDIMRCLKDNHARVSEKCLALHPCIAQQSCSQIDYDSPSVQPHQPVVSQIPQYMSALNQARQSPDSHKPEHNNVPVLHLVLPSAVREGHPSFLGGSGSGAGGIDHAPPAAAADTVHPPAGPAHFGAGAMDAAPHEVPGHATFAAGELASPSFPLYSSRSDAGAGSDGSDASEEDASDEDVVNEGVAGFDQSSLGTGHFSPIHPVGASELAFDVLTRHASGAQADPTAPFDVVLWDAHGRHQQLFDLNARGQVYWIHAGLDSRHFCLTAQVNSVGHALVSEMCSDLEPQHSAQKWEWLGASGQLKHVASGRCVQAAHPSRGAPLTLADCTVPTSQAQHLSWETGSIAHANPNVFAEHQARVAAHHAAQGNHASVHSPYAAAGGAHTSEQSEIQHLAEEDVVQERQIASLHAADAQQEQQIQHLEADDQAQEGEIHRLQAEDQQQESEIHSLQAEEQAEEQQIHHLQESDQQEESQIHHLQDELEHLEARESADHALLEEERRELAEERESMHRMARDQVHRDSTHGEAEEHDLSGARPVTASQEEPAHFFTPVTLLLSVAFVAGLAYVFRVWLCPVFTKRFTESSRGSHYYSHAL